MNPKILLALLGLASASARCGAAPEVPPVVLPAVPAAFAPVVSSQPAPAAAAEVDVKALLALVEAAQGEVGALAVGGVQDAAQVLGEALERVKGARASVEELGLIQGAETAAVRDRVRAAQGVVDELRAAKVRLSSIQNSQQAQAAVDKALSQAGAMLASQKKQIMDWARVDSVLQESRALLERVRSKEAGWAQSSAQAQAALDSFAAIVVRRAQQDREIQQELERYDKLQQGQPQREALLKDLEGTKARLKQQHEAVRKALEEMERANAAKQQHGASVQPDAWDAPLVNQRAHYRQVGSEQCKRLDSLFYSSPRARVENVDLPSGNIPPTEQFHALQEILRAYEEAEMALDSLPYLQAAAALLKPSGQGKRTSVS